MANWIKGITEWFQGGQMPLNLLIHIHADEMPVHSAITHAGLAITDLGNALKCGSLPDRRDYLLTARSMIVEVDRLINMAIDDAGGNVDNS